jgi:hypothetical protein
MKKSFLRWWLTNQEGWKLILVILWVISIILTAVYSAISNSYLIQVISVSILIVPLVGFLGWFVIDFLFLYYKNQKESYKYRLEHEAEIEKNLEFFRNWDQKHPTLGKRIIRFFKGDNKK